ncbi:hypothetical protein ES703_48672 [subsurface metagenome]
MARFGYEDIGIVIVNVDRGVCRFQLTENGSLSQITAYIRPTEIFEDVMAVIYKDLNGAPGKLMGYTDFYTVPNVGAWYEFAFSPEIKLLPGYYWLGIQAEAPVGFFYDAGVANQLANGSYGMPLPDPFGAPTNYYAYEGSVYADYTALPLVVNKTMLPSGSRHTDVYANTIYQSYKNTRIVRHITPAPFIK